MKHQPRARLIVVASVAVSCCVMGSAWVVGATGCGPSGGGGGNVTVERLPDVQPNLPAVPTIPPPPHPVQYPDSTYSVYGLRRRAAQTMDTDVQVTGYIVQIFEPPECPAGQQCPRPPAPHIWVADTRDEADQSKRLQIVGYAENHQQVEDAIAGRNRPSQEEIEGGMIPVPTDFAVGAKIKLNGRFTHVSGFGFNSSNGLLEYRTHEILEPAPGAPEG